jgi:cytosine deaminase
MDDLHIAHAGHWETGQPIHIAVRNGVIREVSDRPLHGQTRETVDANGFVDSPAYVEPHNHLDKVLITEGSRPGATFEQQIEAVALSKRNYTAENVALRAESVARLMVMRGVSCIRTFADVDSFVGLTALRGLLLLRDRLRDLIDLQIVAFPQHGLFADPGSIDRLREAMALGANLLGGHPQLEVSEADGHRQIAWLFDMAREYDCDLDFHVDENDAPGSRWLDAVVTATLEHGWHGRVNVAHCASLIKRPAEEREYLCERIQRAGVTIVSSPTSGLLFRGHGDVDPTRGIVPVRELLDRGIRVACAQEVYRSVFAPNLRLPDPVFTAQIMAYSAKLSDELGLQEVWRMVTTSPARALGMDRYGLEVGCRANFVLLQGRSASDVLTTLAPARKVYREGRLIARSSFVEQICGEL